MGAVPALSSYPVSVPESGTYLNPLDSKGPGAVPHYFFFRVLRLFGLPSGSVSWYS